MIKVHPSEHNFEKEPLDIKLIQDWRGYYVDILVKVFALIACMGLVASLFRYYSIGWLNIYYVHITACLIIVSLFIVRKRVSTNLKCTVLILASFIGGLAGTLSFGLAGTGIIYVIHAATFAAIFVNRQLALMIISVLAAFILVVGFLFTKGTLQADVDLNQYVGNYTSWLATLFGPIFISVVFIFVISKVRANLIKALLQLEDAKSELKQAALHDSLTGLPNTRFLKELYEDHTKNMRRGDDPLAILLIDLDNFKYVNDRYGHMDADKLLIEIANRMKASIRGTDTAARIGGDEFVVLLRNIKHEEDVERIAKKIITSINAAFEIMPGETVYQGLSIGASVLENPAKISLESFMKEADIAMYKLKALGKNGFYLSDRSFFNLNKGEGV